MSLSRNHFPSWRERCRLEGGWKVVHEASLKEDQFLYHFLPWPFAESIFRNRGLRLSPVQSWKDPYEKAWCQRLFEGEGQLRGVNAYGLCWTTSRYDEPSWRMAAFGRDCPIVRIRCHVKAILETGCDLIQTAAGSLFLGKVRYVRQKTLRMLAQRVRDKGHTDVSYTASGLLLQKRNAFRFEKEVRLMWFDREAAREHFIIPIDPQVAISQIMTSPYASDKEHEDIVSFLKPYKIETKKSGLLWEPDF